MNLPPETRFHQDNILCVGVIPGPKKPHDMDSFLWPLVTELLKLAAGVVAFDALSQSLFLLRAHLILVCGDIPAISLLMSIKGHNAFCPCRMCTITGVTIPQSPGEGQRGASTSLVTLVHISMLMEADTQLRMYI